MPRPSGRGLEDKKILQALAKKGYYMPYTKVFIHFIWATKNREHLISKELNPVLLQHMRDNTEEYQEFINGHDFKSILAEANT